MLRRNMTISALSCHGNPVHPDAAKAEEYHEDMCHTVQLAEKLGIDLAPFSVRAPKPEELKNYRSKAQVYRQIEAELGCGFPAMMAVGDRFHVDIEPLLELGGCGAEVHHPDEIAALFAPLFGERRA